MPMLWVFRMNREVTVQPAASLLHRECAAVGKPVEKISCVCYNKAIRNRKDVPHPTRSITPQ